MRSFLRTALLTGSVLAALAAVPALEAQQDTTARAATRRPRGDRNKLTPEEINGAGNVATAADAIRLLRPWWLQPPRGRMASTDMGGDTRAATQVVVYIDGMRQPDLESSLVTVKAADVTEIRYHDQNRAVQNFGAGHEAGVIDVTTINKKRR
ncbi:MAG: hypothetical protein IPJ78_13395 [Gemmatimonadetes bacterium]|nr:hypothetical protein [Gemmatimonadota bacterium]